MNREKINSFLESDPSIQELRRFAKMLGVRLKRTMKKKEIVKAVCKFAEKETPVLERSVTSQAAGNLSQVKRPSKPVDAELPVAYARDCVVLHPINPYWIYAMWSLGEITRKTLSSSTSATFVRVSDITNIIYDGKNAHRFKEAEITPGPGNWYFQVDFPDADYIGEIGYYSEGIFVAVLKSNIIRTPRNTPKFAENESWINLKKGFEHKMTASRENFDNVSRAKSSSPSDNPSSEEFIKKISKSKSGK